jgi:hypothetical protein
MFLTLSLAVAAAAPVPPDPFEKQVAPAREKAVGYLLRTGGPEGRWDNPTLNVLGGMEGGADALATLALLEAGVPANEPAVAAALARFDKAAPVRTYVVALQTAALAKADVKRYAVAIQRNADWLVENASRRDNRLTGWSYPFAPNQGTDGSNTQYAVLGLSAAADAGAKVDPKVWVEVRELYVRTTRAGGWSYSLDPPRDPGTVTMTAGALCGLLLADRHLKKFDEKASAAIKAGTAEWLKMYAETPADWLVAGPGSKSAYYERYGTARLGRLGAKLDRADGTAINWYRDGATWLVKNQNPNGSWPTKREHSLDSYPVITTSFALLFLGPPRK